MQKKRKGRRTKDGVLELPRTRELGRWGESGHTKEAAIVSEVSTEQGHWLLSIQDKKDSPAGDSDTPNMPNAAKSCAGWRPHANLSSTAIAKCRLIDTLTCLQWAQERMKVIEHREPMQVTRHFFSPTRKMFQLVNWELLLSTRRCSLFLEGKKMLQQRTKIGGPRQGHLIDRWTSDRSQENKRTCSRWMEARTHGTDESVPSHLVGEHGRNSPLIALVNIQLNCSWISKLSWNQRNCKV